MDETTDPLPLPLPRLPAERVMLIAMRRMGAHGLHDAHAAMLIFNTYGIGFRRPLVLLRAFMMELARGAQRQIVIAPCCARRMTRDEGRLLACLSGPELAETVLRELCGTRDVAAVHSVAVMMAQAI